MRFYFDEAGDFAVPNDRQTHAVGIVVGVDIPETIENEVFDKYQQFVSTLASKEMKMGEPKGYLITNQHLRDFAEMFANVKGLLVTTTLLDLTTLAKGRLQSVDDAMVAKFDNVISQCVYDSLKEEISLLSRQYKNLSANQRLRLFAWSTCVFETLHQCILWRAARSFDNCWKEMTFTLDPVQTKQGSREQQFFEKQVLAWTAGRSKKKAFALVDEWHTPDHPFVQKYETEAGVDIGLLLRNNFRWPSSLDSLGLQIADISATIVRNAVRGFVDAGALHTYGLLMTRSTLGVLYAPGLVLLGDIPSSELGDRYYGLTGAIQRARNHMQ